MEEYARPTTNYEPLTLRYFGDPVLRAPAQPVTAFDDVIHELAGRMIATMQAASGVGLAAQQIGRTEAICVIGLPPEMDIDADGQPANSPEPMPLVLLNPHVTWVPESSWAREEGCLSFPEIEGKITRPWTIHVTYQDLQGQSQERTWHGMLARVVQHEVDHLNGVLFIDRMSHVKRLALKGRLKRLKEEYAEYPKP